MDIKMYARYKFYIGVSIIFVVVVVIFATLGIINNLSTRQSYTNIKVDQLAQKSDSTIASIATESQASAPIPGRNIDEAMNFLDMLDVSDYAPLDIYAQNTSANVTNKKSVVHDEQLLQKYHSVRITPEYKDIESKYNRLMAELYKLPSLDILREQLMEYEENPFAVFGLTKEEGEQRSWSDSDLQYIQDAKSKLEQQLKEYEEVAKTVEDEKDRLQQKRLELLGMTEEEYTLVIKLDQERRQAS
jgi:hypothetical protein